MYCSMTDKVRLEIVLVFIWRLAAASQLYLKKGILDGLDDDAALVVEGPVLGHDPGRALDPEQVRVIGGVLVRDHPVAGALEPGGHVIEQALHALGQALDDLRALADLDDILID